MSGEKGSEDRPVFIGHKPDSVYNSVITGTLARNGKVTIQARGFKNSLKALELAMSNRPLGGEISGSLGQEEVTITKDREGKELAQPRTIQSPNISVTLTI